MNQAVTLYRSAGCLLCDHARATLIQLARRLQFELEEVDIEGDDELLRRYMLEIPVIAVGGEVVAAGRIVPSALEDSLRKVLQRA